ncbi:DinB family protein [Zafaria sp. Z1313]|uniref:DinB family protein n=1 Tax=Zafaria sp. Z1313 TaxID=3423202 RepID=UPI003D303C4E
MTIIDEQGRTEPPGSAGELETLTGFLDYQRQTLEWKCRGLGADGLRATTAASAMTLGGLLKHMAWVEDFWFGCQLLALEPDPAWRDVDWKRDPDWEWNSAAGDEPEALRALWDDAVARSRAHVARAVADGGLGRPADHARHGEDPPSLRWILVHMIEEYARHNGHADLLREAVDGETGE